MLQFIEAHRPALKIHLHSGKILSVHVNPMNIKINHTAEISPLSFCFENFSFIASFYSILANVSLIPYLPC